MADSKQRRTKDEGRTTKYRVLHAVAVPCGSYLARVGFVVGAAQMQNAVN